MEFNNIRNIAIIAHVDHGKTTFVDAMLRQSGAFRSNQVVNECVMDNNDLERERGITILSKNTSILYKNTKINIVDTPGHADFSGEVERVLKMIDGVILLVDAYEGPMPQTRFVLEKALQLDLSLIIAINKIDKPSARVSEVENEVLDLLIELGAEDKALEYPFIYCSGRNEQSSFTSEKLENDFEAVFQSILKYIPEPLYDDESPLQMLVSSIDYNDYVGRIGIGKVTRGTLLVNTEVMVCDTNSSFIPYKAKITNIYTIENLDRKSTSSARSGDIVCFSGIPQITIGNSVCSTSKVEPIQFVNVSEPTMQMQFIVNNSPYAGQDGKYVTSRNLIDRLMRETLKDVSLRIEQTEAKDCFIVSGRGEIHISILIENMRREGYEFQVGKPQVITKIINNKKCEPVEKLVVDVPEQYMGAVMEKLGSRKAELQDMKPIGNRFKITFVIPTRGLIGYKTDFFNDTRGEGIINSTFIEFQEFKGEMPKRNNGVIVAHETGETTAYGLYHAQDRGVLFVSPQTRVYQGMIVGVCPKSEDISINVCKKKHITNIRASGSDDALRLNSVRDLSLEQAMEFIEDDELIEITPLTFRLRKRILDPTRRQRSKN